MRKQVGITTAYKYLDVCDRCGIESEQDDILIFEEFMGLNIALHRRCRRFVRNQLRKSLGLLEEN